MGKKTVQQREEELAQKIMDDVNAGMDERFAKFERLMERFAGAAEDAAPEVQHVPVKAVTRSDKRKADSQDPEGTPTPKVSKAAPKRAKNVTFHSASNSNDVVNLVGVEQTPGPRPRQSQQATPLHPSPCFAEPPPVPNYRVPAATAGFVDQQTSAAHREHLPPTAAAGLSGKNDSWPPWSTTYDRQPSVPYNRQPSTTSNTFTLPTSTHDLVYNETVDSQVKQLLATTVHNLGKGNTQPFDFPYKYISRGPEKIKATINSVTLPEHLWGIFRIIHDQKTSPDIKSCLMAHIEQIVEDAREYEWETGVRRWSEEVFSRISEGRLLNGWHTSDEIQRLRMILAQSKPLLSASVQQSQQYSRDNYTKKAPTSSQQQTDILRGGPPCPEYNSTTGCTLKSGHIKNGKRFVHVCSFCLHNTSAPNPHPEVYCRNKIRLTGAHTHFQ